MRFKTLTIRNFLSLAEAHVTFEPGVHLIHGINFDMGADGQESNGSGKSSIMDALLWSLYGILNRPKGKENSVINTAEGKNCRVRVVFEHNGETFQVDRFRKDDEDGNGMRWWRGGKEQTGSQSRDSQKDLEAALPVSAEVFKHAIQVGQGMPDKFLDLPESAKQDLLCQMVDLTMYDRALERVKGSLAETSSQATMAEGTLRGLHTQIQNWEAELAQYKSALVAYERQTEQDRSQLQGNMASIDTQLSACQGRLTDIQGKVAPIEQQVQDARKSASASAEVARAIYGQGSALKARWQEKESAKKRVADRPTQCPTCKRPLELEDMSAHLAELSAEQADLMVQQKALATDYRKAKARADAAQTIQTQAEQALSKLSAESYQLQATVRDLQSQKDKLSGQLQSYDRQIQSLRNKVEVTEQSIEKMQASVEPNQQRLIELKLQIDHWTYWKESLPGLRASAIEEVLGFVNERLAYYMDIFSGGAMGVTLYQEQHGKGSRIKVDLKTPADTYGMSSGGEKRRIDLAIYLSLSDLLQASAGVKCNILAADEICDGLSPLGVRQFLEVLRQKAEDTCVFVVSHNPAVSQNFEFDSIKVVERKNGRARLLQS